MSQRDRDRLRIIQQVSEGRLSQVDAAEQLGLTARHVRRLVKRLVRRGDSGLIHQSRGKPSHNRFDGNFWQRILRRYKSRYSDFGPTLAAEKLAEDNIVVAAETLRGWLIGAEPQCSNRTWACDRFCQASGGQIPQPVRALAHYPSHYNPIALLTNSSDLLNNVL